MVFNNTARHGDGRPQPGSMVGHSIDNGNLQFVKLIGVGTYGEVYLAVDRRTGESYAVKVLPRKPTNPLPTSTAQSRLQRQSNRAAPSADEQQFVDARLLSREVALFARIPQHNNIIRLERMLHTQDQLFMVMEHCPGGDLYENISTNPYFQLPGNDALIRRLFLQLASAIQHCHKHGVYHRDIKPENVLVTRDGLNIKLIDFGLSTGETWCREIGCGSAYYMSPECQGGIHVNVDQYAAAPNDVWALGIILINLATGRNPWNRAHISDPLFRRFITDKSFLCKAIRATPELRHIIYRTLDVNPMTRCTLEELQRLVQSCPRFIEPAVPDQKFGQQHVRQHVSVSPPTPANKLQHQSPTLFHAPIKSPVMQNNGYENRQQQAAAAVVPSLRITPTLFQQQNHQQHQQQQNMQHPNMHPVNNGICFGGVAQTPGTAMQQQNNNYATRTDSFTSPDISFFDSLRFSTIEGSHKQQQTAHPAPPSIDATRNIANIIQRIPQAKLNAAVQRVHFCGDEVANRGTPPYTCSAVVPATATARSHAAPVCGAGIC
ncbi:kinase-like domain-containing protein [Coemansia spiralis]|nr:kinase-like domain-containing protein [Coemansia spiralis]